MEPLNFQLEAVKERFPEFKSDILALYYHDNEFRTICEDYYLCLQYLNKFQKEFSERREYIEEYERTLVDLEKELHERINRNK